MFLIDADILVYRIGWSCNDEEEGVALRRLNSVLLDLLYVDLNCPADEDNAHTPYVLYLTGKGNFRNDYAITAKYKGNRDNKPKPIHIQAIRQHLIDQWDAVVTDNEEADDAIAIAATTLGEEGVIVSLDKDFLQVPTRMYNFVKRTWTTTNEFDGMHFLYRQMLMGDRIDNIIGIKGIGEVKSSKLLAECTTEREHYDKVVEVYAEHEELDTAAAEVRVIENARLLYLRRVAGEIWEPPHAEQ
tara:strand:- start:4146 stop:4877 length:732 start_codon:yes stop_codon:yes gene_type:complete